MRKEHWITVVLPTIFACLGAGVWVTGIMLNDKAGGQSLSTQLVTLAAAAWQKEKSGDIVSAANVEEVNVDKN